MNDVECPGKAAGTRRRRLTGTGFTRLESRLWGLGLCGEVVLTRVAFPEHDTTIPCQMAKSNAPRTFFPFFFGGAAGRPVGRLWPLAVGGKEKPPTSADFRRYADSGGEIAPSVWVTNPRARTFAPWLDWRTHNIHHVIIMSSESEWKSRRIHCAVLTGPTASGSACHGTFLTAFSGRLSALRSICFITNTRLYHRLLGTEKRFTRCQEYANETRLH